MTTSTTLMERLMIKITIEESVICIMMVWGNMFFTSTDAAMSFHGCGVSMYPQFYDKIL